MRDEIEGKIGPILGAEPEPDDPIATNNDDIEDDAADSGIPASAIVRSMLGIDVTAIDSIARHDLCVGRDTVDTTGHDEGSSSNKQGFLECKSVEENIWASWDESPEGSEVEND